MQNYEQLRYFYIAVFCVHIMDFRDIPFCEHVIQVDIIIAYLHSRQINQIFLIPICTHLHFSLITLYNNEGQIPLRGLCDDVLSDRACNVKKTHKDS